MLQKDVSFFLDNFFQYFGIYIIAFVGNTGNITSRDNVGRSFRWFATIYETPKYYINSP